MITLVKNICPVDFTIVKFALKLFCTIKINLPLTVFLQFFQVIIADHRLD